MSLMVKEDDDKKKKKKKKGRASIGEKRDEK